MNTEYCMNWMLSTLQTYLAAELAIVEAEASATYTAGNISEYLFGARDPDLLVNFPSLQVRGKNSQGFTNGHGFQERVARIEIVVWCVSDDLEKLERYLVRYGDAIARVLRKENILANYIDSLEVQEAMYSDLYTSDMQWAKGVSISVNVKYINS